jgi:hypothetical protein
MSEKLPNNNFIPNRTFLGGGFDSLVHVIFGGLSVTNPIGVPIFLAYELLLPHHQPEYSLTEFGFGYLVEWIRTTPKDENLLFL